MPSLRLAALGLVVLALGAGCATSADTEAEGASAALESAPLPKGHFEVSRKPLSDSYIKSVTFDGERVALDFVRVRISTPFVFNPFFTTREEEVFSLIGTAFTFDSGGETKIAFDVGEPFGSLSYDFELQGDKLKLQAIGQSAFELKSAAVPADKTEKRVLRCKHGLFDAIITLDKNERRRGTMQIIPTDKADPRRDPPAVTFPVAFTGNTGVRDAMAYEGMDEHGNGYDFALSAGQVAQTSGPVTDVGMGFTREFTSFAMHHSLDCNVATK